MQAVVRDPEVVSARSLLLAQAIAHARCCAAAAISRNVDGQIRVGMFAREDLFAGEEITFDYSFERYGAKKTKCVRALPAA